VTGAMIGVLSSADDAAIRLVSERFPALLTARDFRRSSGCIQKTQCSCHPITPLFTGERRWKSGWRPFFACCA
jgi:hypothetical protein